MTKAPINNSRIERQAKEMIEAWRPPMRSAFFVNGKIHARLSQELKPGEPVLVGIPGGPGISGQYMDEVTFKLADAAGAIGMVIDLPNHGLSPRPDDSALNYNSVRAILSRFLREIATNDSPVYLIGHSMGAYIALDLLRDSPNNVQRAAMISTPAHFGGSPSFDAYVKAIGANNFDWKTESEFVDWWRRVLPAYFKRTPSLAELDSLSKGTSWKINETFLDGAPTLREVFSELKSNRRIENIFLIEGEREIVLPDENKKIVGELFENRKVHITENSGHFPMIENKKSLLESLTAFFNLRGF